MTAIYTLSDPRDGQIYYVGQTSRSLGDRLFQHIRTAQRQGNKTMKEQWIAGMLNEGLFPIITTLEVCEREQAYEREAFWINKFLAEGERLYNTVLNPHKANTPKTGMILRLSPERKAESPPDESAKDRQGGWRKKRRRGRKSQPRTENKYGHSGISNSELIYEWLIENDPGWSLAEVPSARAILRETEMEDLISSGSAHRGRTRFIQETFNP